ncbi:MAG: hypothetical protein JWQ74_1635 [Marmoricola sp.]|nr:hypothetical protein [Marmoricola sp.]
MHRLTQRLCAASVVVLAAASVAGCGGSGEAEKKAASTLPASVVPKAFCSELDLAAASALTTAPVTSFKNSFSDNTYTCLGEPGQNVAVAVGVPTRTMADQRRIAATEKAKVAAVPGVDAAHGIYNQATSGQTAGQIYVMLFVGDNAVQCTWLKNEKGATPETFGQYCVDQANRMAK